MPTFSAQSNEHADEVWLDVLVVSAGERAPLSGVRLSLSGPDVLGTRSIEYVDSATGDLDHQPRTGEDGRARLRLEPATAHHLGVVAETVRAQSKRLEVEPIAAGTRRELVVELATAYDLVLHGRVVEREIRKPIQGAVVRVHDFPTLAEHNRREQAPVIEVTSDADGRFVMRGPGWVPLDGTIEARGFSTKVFQLVAGHESIDHEQTFELDRSSILVVRVLDKRREPIGGARVVLKTKPWLLSEDPSGTGLVDAPDPTFRAETAEDGRATFEDLPASAPFEVDVRSGKSSRRESSTVSLAPGERREIGIVLGGGARLAGKLVDESGASLGQHAVSLTKPMMAGHRRVTNYPAPHAQAVTDKEGRFVFQDVPAGEWLVGPPEEYWNPGKKPVSEVLVPEGEIVAVEVGVDPPELVLVARHGLSIGGTVQGPEGATVGCTVLANGDAGGFASGTSGGDGSFEIGPLAAGEYRVQAHPGPLQKSLAATGEVRAKAGDTGVVVVLATGGSISCEARAPDGSRGLTSILLVDGADCTRHVIVFGEGKDGRTTFENLAPCSYSLVATTVDPPRIAILRDVRIASGERKEGVVLELVPAARLRVRCEGADGNGSISVRQDDLFVAGEGIDAGATRTFVVPAGNLVVDVRDPRAGEAVQPTLLLAPGETREITIVPRK